MRDIETNPFRVGDVAYTRAAPGGYASAAAVPADPAYGGSDAAFTVPSLGGEFCPGSGTPAPTGSNPANGADADGGAADIAAAPRIDVPTPPTPPAPVPLAVEVSGFDMVFTGEVTVQTTITIHYHINGDVNEIEFPVIVSPPMSAGLVAAGVAYVCKNQPALYAATTSNQVRVSAKTPNTLDDLECDLAPTP